MENTLLLDLRMINELDIVLLDFSGKYIFIRYNPDSYKDEKGNERKPRFETRMKVLEKEIERHTNRIKKGEQLRCNGELRPQNKDLLEIYYLYYNSQLFN